MKYLIFRKKQNLICELTTQLKIFNLTFELHFLMSKHEFKICFCIYLNGLIRTML